MREHAHFFRRPPDHLRWVSGFSSNGRSRVFEFILLTLTCLLIGCAARPNYTLYPIKQQYVGEDTRADRAVRYVKTGSERKAMRLRVRNGLLVNEASQPLDPSIEEKPNRDGFAIFVMDASGTIYVSFDHQQGSFHHSSLLAGAPVAAAGDMTILSGRLLAISNASGHYRPPPSSLVAVLARLKALGVDISGVKVTRITGSTPQSHNTTRPAQ